MGGRSEIESATTSNYDMERRNDLLFVGVYVCPYQRFRAVVGVSFISFQARQTGIFLLLSLVEGSGGCKWWMVLSGGQHCFGRLRKSSIRSIGL